ncbi:MULTISPECIES: Fic family protein [unclassified Shewanella]|uniref:Fic family protein n=1 Tax=Shewanella TaxID=22 RepID=UPI0021D81DEE|nr:MULTISPECIES: Fic family protein [unclassified Shewanella]MCU8023955.1 Fic family protein [Shewanella sp. SM78]MCU8081024.1 Fic family protein [Shewanella sp. SM103]
MINLISINLFIEMKIMPGKYLAPPECPFETIGDVLLEIGNQGDDPNKYKDYIYLLDEYHSFNEFRRRVKSGLDAKYCWWLMRLSRNNALINLAPLEDKPLPPDLPESVNQALLQSPDFITNCRFNNLHEFSRVLSQIDRYTTHGAMLGILEQIGESAHFEHLKNNLIDDEAISSSQLEGAATTTILAKEMLRKKRKPRTEDERMISGNFDLMQAAWDLKDEPLSIGLIQELHKVGTQTLEQKKYTSGAFRIRDNVVVVNSIGETVHQPPKHDAIERLLSRVANWLNSTDDQIHPVIRAITLHFVIGYVHPFLDGNGRVARALFYWYMFKCGYTGFRYIAISALLKKAPIQYGQSYLDCEHDNLDLTYFIKYQLSVIHRAIAEFMSIYEGAAYRMNELDEQYSGLEDIEKKIIGFVAGEPRYRKKPTITARETERLLGVSYNTVKQKLDDMVTAGILGREKMGKATEYFLA